MTSDQVHHFHKWIVGVFLLPPWIAFVVATYWLFFDTAPAIYVEYEYPQFLKGPARNRLEAAALGVDTVKSFESLYIYREVCVRHQPINGSIKATWEAGSFMWSAPERAIPEFPLGCTTQSFNLQAPTTNPTRDFVYMSTWEWEQNPLVHLHVTLNSLKIRVLAPTEGTDMVRR